MNQVDNNSERYTRSLKIAETDSRFVGKGMALLDPEVMKEMNLNPGDVIEITSKRNKNTFVLLWSSSPTDYGKGLIRIDGYTRNNLGEGIDDRVIVKSIDDIRKAEQIILSPTEELNIAGLEEHLPELLDGRWQQGAT